MTVTPLGPDGRVCVFNRGETDVIVDLQGQKDTMEILNRLNRCFPVADNQAERDVQTLRHLTESRPDMCAGR